METDPPRHRQFRRIFAADFTPRSVRRYEPWLRDLVVEVLDAALALGEFEAVHDIAAPIPIRVLARILGLRTSTCRGSSSSATVCSSTPSPSTSASSRSSGERDEDRYLPFGSPWADELCALGREYYADAARLPATTCSR